MIPKKRTGLHLTRKIYTGTWKYAGLSLREEDILEAMKYTKSNNEAAKYLGISYPTYKKYAKAFVDPITGKTLWETHLNQSGLGTSRPNLSSFKEESLDELLRPNQTATEKRIASLKIKLLADGRLGQACSCCGYDKVRKLDNRSPLLLHFKDFDRSNWSQDNITLLCYNCAFDKGLDEFSKSVMRIIDAFGVLDEGITNSARRTFYQLENSVIDALNVVEGLNEASERAARDEKEGKDESDDDGSEMSLVSYLW